MRVLALAVLFTSLLIPALPAHAEDCQFVLGFKAIRDMIPDKVGACKGNEYFNPSNGDSMQQTTGGLLVWRKADNWTAFTNGHQTWVNGPFGLSQRLNNQRFLWEMDALDFEILPLTTAEVDTCTSDAGSSSGPIGVACFTIYANIRIIESLGNGTASQPPATPAPPEPALTLSSIDGRAILVSDDGTYLGIVSSNQFASDSICNEFGNYGNPFSDKSVRNQFGKYGNPFSDVSAYNMFTSRPPLIVLNDRAIGRLTKNESLAGAVDPDLLFAVLQCPSL